MNSVDGKSKTTMNKLLIHSEKKEYIVYINARGFHFLH